MKKILTAFAAIALLASCQKELSFDSDNPANPGGPGPGGTGGSSGSTNGLLRKAVAVTGSETTTTTYTYDSQDRLETMTIKSVGGSFPVDNYHKYVRDVNGRISKVIQKIDNVPGANVDTSTKFFHYPNATTLEYDYSVMDITADFGGFPMTTTDSTVYMYSSGKMTSNLSHMLSSLMPGNVMSKTRYDFLYDASNKVTGMKVFNDVSNPGGPMELFADYTYTYAATTVNNVYAATSAAQNFAMHGLPNTGAHIITKMQTVSTNPSMTVVITTSFVNGANNKPVTATTVATTTGQPTQTTNYTFYYQ